MASPLAILYLSFLDADPRELHGRIRVAVLNQVGSHEQEETDSFNYHPANRSGFIYIQTASSTI